MSSGETAVKELNKLLAKAENGKLLPPIVKKPNASSSYIIKDTSYNALKTMPFMKV
jgi:hypothetical protein